MIQEKSPYKCEDRTDNDFGTETTYMEKVQTTNSLESGTSLSDIVHTLSQWHVKLHPTKSVAGYKRRVFYASWPGEHRFYLSYPAY